MNAISPNHRQPTHHTPQTNEKTHFTPFPLNSSPSATPLAFINLRLKVDAALIPVGNPVTPLVSLTPAGPSCRQIDGIPRRGTALVSPTHRLLNWPRPLMTPSFSAVVIWATVRSARVKASGHVPVAYLSLAGGDHGLWRMIGRTFYEGGRIGEEQIREEQDGGRDGDLHRGSGQDRRQQPPYSGVLKP